MNDVLSTERNHLPIIILWCFYLPFQLSHPERHCHWDTCFLHHHSKLQTTRTWAIKKVWRCQWHWWLLDGSADCSIRKGHVVVWHGKSCRHSIYDIWVQERWGRWHHLNVVTAEESLVPKEEGWFIDTCCIGNLIGLPIVGALVTEIQLSIDSVNWILFWDSLIFFFSLSLSVISMASPWWPPCRGHSCRWHCCIPWPCSNEPMLCVPCTDPSPHHHIIAAWVITLLSWRAVLGAETMEWFIHWILK